MSGAIGTKAFNFEIPTPEEGDYLVEIVAVDQSGNKSSREKVKVSR